MYPTPRSHRPLIMGRRGAVGANHPLATQAGLDVRRAGGNAVDAAVAIGLPRWTSSQARQGANWPHHGDGVLTIERDVGEEVLAGLTSRGHSVTAVGHLEGPCAMQAIRIMPNGVRMAASDTRRDGWAGAY